MERLKQDSGKKPMHRHAQWLGFGSTFHALRRPWMFFGLACCAVAAVGCEEQPRNVGGKPSAPAAPKAERGIIGRRTQDVRNAPADLKKEKAQVATTRIVAKDPITLQGNAYVSIIGRASQLLIDDAINKFRALNDRYPKDYEEFMAEIIKANNISLPVLPPYQEYGYLEKEHKLIILEYPDRKNPPAV
jgi:hypothetical protein